MDPSINYFTYSRRGIEEAAKEEMSKLPSVGISGTTKIHAVIGPEPGFIKTHQLLLVRVFSLKWYLPRGLWEEGGWTKTGATNAPTEEPQQTACHGHGRGRGQARRSRCSAHLSGHT